jgi:uncharacterized DUF497 family protein
MRRVHVGRGQATDKSPQARHRFRGRAEDLRGAHVYGRGRPKPYAEHRFLTLGLLEDQVVSVAHTERGDEIGIISIRKATKHEARFYFSQVTN